MNFCPPKPGSMVITRTMSMRETKGITSSTGVPGLIPIPTLGGGGGRGGKGREGEARGGGRGEERGEERYERRGRGKGGEER